MKQKLFRFTLLLATVCCLVSCQRTQTLPTLLTEEAEKTEAENPPTVLRETADLGQSYLDSFVFLGESTTYHLINRGVLSGGQKTTQVWGPDSGTVNLDTTICSLRIRYPDTGEQLTVREATERKKPAYLVLTFGLNGATQNVRKGKDYYKACYRMLLDEIRSASPNTKIILQSCFPVAKNMDMRYYTVSAKELNDYIEIINSWVLELAEEYGLRYLNTGEILTDKEGFLLNDYQNGDGYHLTKEAYVKILHYIRTHGYQ